MKQSYILRRVFLGVLLAGLIFGGGSGCQKKAAEPITKVEKKISTPKPEVPAKEVPPPAEMESKKKPEEVTIEKKEVGETLTPSVVKEGAPQPLPPYVRAKSGRPTEDRIREIAAMLDDAQGVFAPSIQDRAFWGSVNVAREEIIKKADRWLEQPVPELPDELYLEYSKTGSRESYMKPYYFRCDRVAQFALAECLQNEGRYLPAIQSNIEAILSEKTWVIPAHEYRDGIHSFQEEPQNVDLFAAMRAANLATIDAWLGEKLSPELRAKIAQEIQRRITAPYLRRIYGDGKGCGWADSDNNWNAVCHAGVVYATLHAVRDRETRAKVVAGAERFIVEYLNGIYSDGYCTEGIGYWSYGFGNYVVMAERIYQATSGRLNLLKDPVIPAVAAFPLNFKLAPQVYPSFSDNPSTVVPATWIYHVLARRVDFPKAALEENPIPTGLHPIGTMLYETDLVIAPPKTEETRVSVPSLNPLRGYFPNAGSLVVRPSDPMKGMSVAMNGGHNGESHNHNDLGSFVIVVAGKMVSGDPGGEKYTKRTFSAQRYDSKVINSFGHPVPRIDGQLQATGQEAAAEVTKVEFSPEKDLFVLDLKKGYPVGGLTRLQRSFDYRREGTGSLEIVDEMSASKPLTFETALITAGTFDLSKPESIVIMDGDRGVRVIVDTGGKAFELKEEPLNEEMVDKRNPRRLGIVLKEPATEFKVVCRFEPIMPPDGK